MCKGKYWYIYTKCDANIWNLSNEKTQYSFILNYRGVGEKLLGREGNRVSNVVLGTFSYDN